MPSSGHLPSTEQPPRVQGTADVLYWKARLEPQSRSLALGPRLGHVVVRRHAAASAATGQGWMPRRAMTCSWSPWWRSSRRAHCHCLGWSCCSVSGCLDEHDHSWPFVNLVAQMVQLSKAFAMAFPKAARFPGRDFSPPGPGSYSPSASLRLPGVPVYTFAPSSSVSCRCATSTVGNMAVALF